MRVISSLELELVQITCKDSVPVAKETRRVSMTSISWLTPFREVIPVYSKNRHENIKCILRENEKLRTLTAGGTYEYSSYTWT